MLVVKTCGGSNMSITAKELALKLGISATAVSMALNNKPGVSRETREKVIRCAEEYGYDFSKISHAKNKQGSIYCIVYHKHNAILNYAPVFDEIIEGIERECYENGFLLKTIQLYGKKDNIEHYVENLQISDCVGILLLATEMDLDICNLFLQLSIPLVLVDNNYDTLKCSSISINNMQGAYVATDYLISELQKQPGYLSSSYMITNFKERKAGFERAVKEHGMSVSKYICHSLSPSIEGAFYDMLELIDNQCELAECYFADNDLIAIGAMRAFKARGYSIPKDIAIIGVDNISESCIVEPALSTIDIPRCFMGQTAVKQLISEIRYPIPHKVKIEIATDLIKRWSM